MLLSYLESILYSHLEYDTISSNYMCHHVDGGLPNRCYCKDGECPASCQNACSSYGWCVGYSDRQSKFLEGCILHSSSSSCSSGWHLAPGKLAKTASQLIASSVSGWKCMAKLGKVSK